MATPIAALAVDIVGIEQDLIIDFLVPVHARPRHGHRPRGLLMSDDRRMSLGAAAPHRAVLRAGTTNQHVTAVEVVHGATVGKWRASIGLNHRLGKPSRSLVNYRT